MAKTWSDFLPLLEPYAPGVPRATAQLYLAQAAAEFFAKTYLWREELDPIYLTAGVAEYDIDVYLCGGVLEDVKSVTLDGVGRPLTRTTIDAIPADRRADSGVPTHYWMVADRGIRVWPTPTTRFVARIDSVLKTSRTAIEVPDWIYETWADALVAGAAARLRAIPGKEWSDPALAAQCRLDFDKAIVGARIRANRTVDLTVSPRPAMRGS